MITVQIYRLEETLWSGALPLIPRIGETVSSNKDLWDGVVKFITWDLDGPKGPYVILELE